MNLVYSDQYVGPILIKDLGGREIKSLTFGNKSNITDRSLWCLTHLKCYCFQTPTNSRSFTSLIYICTLSDLFKHTLLIPSSDINFQTSCNGVNDAFLWAIGSDFVSLAIIAC